MCYAKGGGVSADCSCDEDEAQRPRSYEIPVDRFRLVLFWPLILRPPMFTDPDRLATWEAPSALVKDIANRIDSEAPDKNASPAIGWQRIEDPLHHIRRGPGTANRTADAPSASNTEGETPCRTGAEELCFRSYEEFLYFHDYIQDFLFRKPETGEMGYRAGAYPSPQPFHLFHREDVDTCRITIEIGSEFVGGTKGCFTRLELSLNVDRLNLYLFDCGVAIIATELAGGRDCVAGIGNPPAHPDEVADLSQDGCPQLNLAIVQQFADQVRRAFTPYWEPDDGGDSTGAPCWFRPGRTPCKVEWRNAESGRVIVAGDCTPKDYAGATGAILHGTGIHRRRRVLSLPHWRGLLPYALRDGLEEATPEATVWRDLSDERMSSMLFATVPDTAAISRGDWIRLCFVDAPGTDALPYQKGFLKDFEKDHCYDRFWHYGLRYCLSGYAFSMVTSTEPTREASMVENHFRRQYFQFGLLNTLELCALVSYSSWISQAIGRHPPTQRPKAFERLMVKIEGEFQNFVHRYRFTGVTNQMQGRELQKIWRRHLELDAIFDDVREELRTASEFLVSDDQQTRALADSRLNRIAALFAVLGLPMALFGMNLAFGESMIGDVSATLGLPTHFAMQISAFTAAVGLMMAFWWLVAGRIGCDRAGRKGGGWFARFVSRWTRKDECDQTEPTMVPAFLVVVLTLLSISAAAWLVDWSRADGECRPASVDNRSPDCGKSPASDR